MVISCLSHFPSLLQDGQLPRLEKGLNHPHPEDVHFSIHQDFFFLKKLFEDKEKWDTSESVLLVWRLGSLTSWHHSVIKPHRLFSTGIHPEAKGWPQQILKGVSQGLLNDLLQQRKGLYDMTGLITHLHHLQENKRDQDYPTSSSYFKQAFTPKTNWDFHSVLSKESVCSPSCCVGLIFSKSSPLMLTRTVWVVQLDRPGSRQVTVIQKKNAAVIIVCSGRLNWVWILRTSPEMTYSHERQSNTKFPWVYLGWLQPLPLCSQFLLWAPSVQRPLRFHPHQSTLRFKDSKCQKRHLAHSFRSPVMSEKEWEIRNILTKLHDMKCSKVCFCKRKTKQNHDLPAGNSSV